MSSYGAPCFAVQKMAGIGCTLLTTSAKGAFSLRASSRRVLTSAVRTRRIGRPNAAAADPQVIAAHF